MAIPSGVDSEYFFPDCAVAEKPFSMVMTGSFSWKPKQHNLRILVSEIFPLIKGKVPQASFKVVGQGIPAELKTLAEAHGVEITGAVPDVRPYVHEAALVLNYLESGGGIALKVLEAMAMCKPVLSNQDGIEGIPAIVAGKHAAVTDGREAFAAEAAVLLQDAPRRGALAREGYDLVLREYAWDRLAERFHRVYTELQVNRELPAAVAS
jgi:glycosyltransferase involved in cell wall biosynthesis